MTVCKACGWNERTHQHAVVCGKLPPLPPRVGIPDVNTPSVSRYVTPVVTPITPNVTTGVTFGTAVTQPVTLERHACPLCGEVHGQAKTVAERQRAYRERKRHGVS